MNVLLFNPPNHRYDLDDLAPPLGLLVLAAALTQEGIESQILDLNLASCVGELPTSPDEFYDRTCAKIWSFTPDVICFTSMGINSHICLELARQLKGKHPKLKNVFGGPHFTSIAFELKDKFPWVDFVLPNEGEIALPRLIKLMQRGMPLSQFLNETLGSILPSLCHPWDSYSKVSLLDYFGANPRRLLNFETSRGCKYNCRFCYSPNFWLNKTDSNPDFIKRDFERALNVGAKHLFLVQDNFLNNRLGAAALCRNLANLSQRPTWNCYATLPDIDDEVSEFLAKAGCISTYIGIDAVTTSQQRQFGKFFAKSQADCVKKIRALISNSIVPTCSFILDPYRWSDEELEETFRWAANLRFEGAELSFHLLTTYGNTKLSGQKSVSPRMVSDDFRIRVMFDCPEVVAENSYSKSWPHLFPFHSRESGALESHKSSVALVHLAQSIISTYPFEISDLVESDNVRVIDLLRQLYNKMPRYVWESPEPAAIKLASRSIFEDELCNSHGFVAAR